MIVTMYNATLTWSHAVIELMVLTVETGTSLMEADCYLVFMMITCMSGVKLSELNCIVGAMLAHLAYITVLLRPMQSTVMITQTPQHGRLCMQDCMPVEVSVHMEWNLSAVNRLSTNCTAGDVTIPGGVTFTEDSDLNGESPQFTLTCTSTGGPATTVTWTRDSETVSGGMTVLDDPVTAQYTHTMTVTGRLGGHYQCTVSNNKPSQDSDQFTVAGSACYYVPSYTPKLFVFIFTQHKFHN